MLSDRVPFDLLSTLRGEPEGTRTLAIKAMLMRGAGLLGRAARCGESRQMRAVLGRLPKTGSVGSDRWRLFRVRPTNHPVNRIAGAAGLLSRCLDRGLVVGMRSEAERSEGRAYLESLAAPPFIGVDRAGEMAVNAVLPFLHAYAGARRDPELAGRSIDVYHGLPRLEENEVTREMRRRLFPDGHAPKLNARRQQGLLHRYKRMTAGPPTALLERPGGAYSFSDSSRPLTSAAAAMFAPRRYSSRALSRSSAAMSVSPRSPVDDGPVPVRVRELRASALSPCRSRRARAAAAPRDSTRAPVRGTPGRSPGSAGSPSCTAGSPPCTFPRSVAAPPGYTGTARPAPEWASAPRRPPLWGWPPAWASARVSGCWPAWPFRWETASAPEESWSMRRPPAPRRRRLRQPPTSCAKPG